MNQVDIQYLNLLRDILENGVKKEDRTGVGTLSVFGRQLRFNLNDGFPLLTTKKVHFKSVLGELLWFLSGSTNNNDLREKYGVTIWDEWADENGDLGRIYGAQWRSWRTLELTKDENGWTVSKIVDQIANVIEQIKKNPNSRRLLVSAWNVGELNQMALPPCHYSFQFYVSNGKLSCMFNMRSTDVFLGLPFNIASYAILTMMIAKVCDLGLGELIYNGGDVHLYLNHIEQAKTQLQREPRELPKLYLNPNVKNIDDFKFEDFILEGYNPHPPIKAEVAV